MLLWGVVRSVVFKKRSSTGILFMKQCCHRVLRYIPSQYYIGVLAFLMTSAQGQVVHDGTLGPAHTHPGNTIIIPESLGTLSGNAGLCWKSQRFVRLGDGTAQYSRPKLDMV